MGGKQQGEIQRQLGPTGVKTDIRPLNLGDFLWIAQERFVRVVRGQRADEGIEMGNNNNKVCVFVCVYLFVCLTYVCLYCVKHSLVILSRLLSIVILV